MSVAVDVDPEKPRGFASPHDFPTAVDRAGVLGRLFDFDVVPNGLFLDEQGIIRHLHVGGFDIRRPEIREQVEALAEADFAAEDQPAFAPQESLNIEILRTELAGDPDNSGLHFMLGEELLREGRAAEAERSFRRAAELDPSDWSAPFALGTALLIQGKKEEAVAAYRAALALDADNFTVRKQIWHVEHPEKFYPEIDLEWQKEEMRRVGYVRPSERAASKG